MRGRIRADENGGTVFCLHALAFAQPCDEGLKGLATLLVTDPLRGNSELLFCGEEAVRPTGYAASLGRQKKWRGFISPPVSLSRTRDLSGCSQTFTSPIKDLIRSFDPNTISHRQSTRKGGVEKFLEI